MKGLVVGFILAGLALCLVSFSAVDASLQLYFDFEEDADGDVKDQSGNGNNGILNGTATVVDEGKFGKGVKLDGSGYVQVPDSPSLDSPSDTGEITIVVWFKKPAGGGWQGFVQKWDAYYLQTNGDGNKVLTGLLDKHNVRVPVGDAVNRSSVGDITPNEWHHAAVTFDGSKVKLYLDGELDFDRDGGDGIADSDVWLGVGARHPGADYLKGIIDEVAVFNQALEAKRIKAIMEKGVLASAAVEPSGRLTSSWGSIKVAY
jgi:hypothetical protein